MLGGEAETTHSLFLLPLKWVNGVYGLSLRALGILPIDFQKTS